MSNVEEFLTEQNNKNIDKMNALAMKHIGDLVQRGLGLSKLTFDITKDV